jgi:hypothetical protein
MKINNRKKFFSQDHDFNEARESIKIIKFT